jgi:hypothetical protein
MGVYHEVAAWTRGNRMDKEPRDVTNCVGTAVEGAAFCSRYIADYVDDPDGTNYPIRNGHFLVTSSGRPRFAASRLNTLGKSIFYAISHGGSG